VTGASIPEQRTGAEEPFVLTAPASPATANEDAVATGPGVAVVVDGAGLPEDLRRGCHHAVSWFARRIADTFRDRLADRATPMRQALADTIAEVAAEHRSTCDLELGSPSATVAAWRTDADHVEYLTLCDASVLVLGADGGVHEVTDDRIESATRPLIDARLEAKQAAGGSVSFTDVRDARREAVEATRNTDEGFWCVQDDPRAAYRAVHGRLARKDVHGIVAASDGATRAYRLLATHSVDEFAHDVLDGAVVAVAQEVREAEESHPTTLTADGLKPHDDLTVVAHRL
jgi:protein phosphatase 2C-like protein